MNYLSVRINPPPLDVPILLRKSKYKIHNGLMLETLDSNHGSFIWQQRDLLSQGYDEWAFTSNEDEVNYKDIR